MAPSTSDYHTLVPKFNSSDPDIRYMTLVDLARLLDSTPQNILSREQSLCGIIVDALIKLLDDINGDVQNQALKCIKPFTSKAPSEILIPFMSKIVNLETSKSKDASITSIAARTLVFSLPKPVPGTTPSRQVTEAYTAISHVLLPKILGQQGNSRSTSSKSFISFDAQKGVSIEALDLLSEVVQGYGTMLTPDQLSATEKCLMKVLNDNNTGPIAKKRAITTLAWLCTWFSDEELSAFISRLVEDFRQSHLTAQKQRILVSVLGAMARIIPTRFGLYLQTLAPFVFGVLSQQEYAETLDAIAEDSYDSNRDDLKEAALRTIENFLTSCPLDMRIFTTEVIESGLRSLTYDPTTNSNASDDEMNIDDNEMMAEEDDDYEQEEQFDEADDASWKIRRSAGKMFNALVASRPDLIDSGLLYERLLPTLIKVFKDREESVQIEALSTTTLIVKNTAATVPILLSNKNESTIKDEPEVKTRKRRRADSMAGALSKEEQSRGYASPAANLPSPTSGPKTELLLQGHDLTSGAVNLLSHKSNPTRKAAIVLLKAFVHLKHDSLVGLLDKIVIPVTGIAVSPQGTTTQSSSGLGISTSGGTVRIEALQLLSIIFDTHSSTTISPFVDQAIKAIASCVDDRNLKIAGEALGAAESVIKALTPPRAFGYDGKSKQFIEKIFDVILRKARSSDADLEVREKAIQAVGVCIARTANVTDHLSASKRTEALGFLRERLAGETTRIPATLAIDSILSADQTGQIDSHWIVAVASELGNQLKKSDHRVRSVGLSAIKKLTSNPSAKRSLNNETLKSLTHLILQLYNTDGLAHIVLIAEILSDLVPMSPQVVVDSVFNQAIGHMVVQNLGGHILDTFLDLIGTVGTAGVGGSLMNELLQNVNVQGDAQVVGATIGTLLAFGGSTIPVKIDSFISEIHNKSDDNRVALALIVLGEVGFILGSESKTTPKVFVESLTSKSERVQAAAATSLGKSAASNTAVFLPVLLQTIKNDMVKRSLSLLSIKELLQQINKSNTNITDYSQQLWDILLVTAAGNENRALTAECVGRLTAIESTKYFPLLYEQLNSNRVEIRSTVIQAVRFAISDSDDVSSDAARPYLVKMLVIMLQDSDIENRRLAMATLQSAARSRVRLVLGSLSQLLPYIVKSSEPDPSLIREVLLGPFKHKVDDGLEMRKGAYEALHAFMDLAYARMNHTTLFDRVLAGLKDDHDIKMLVLLMLTKLITIDREEVARRLDIIAERFQAILATRLKENAVKQEVEKLKETVKEVLVLTVRLRSEFSGPSPATGGQVFSSYLENVKRDYGPQLQAVETELRIHS